MEFRILKKSSISRARIGILKTSHGEIETPTLVPVATQATVKTLNSEEAFATGTQVLIANTFHLHLRPGEAIIKNSGELHKFMNWDKSLMTDSGGFQVFSLGFGKDLGVGKFLIAGDGRERIVAKNSKPKNVRIVDSGVYFTSPVDGKRLFIGPRESIKIQEELGANIIFTFDECTPPLSSYEYTKNSLKKTHSWAKICREVHKTKQALYGIIQGSTYQDLRQESATFINSLDFDGIGIGGDFGNDREFKILDWIMPFIDEQKPRHLLGIGKLDDIEKIIAKGIDTFDCTVPTQYARRGVAFTSRGKLNLMRAEFLKSKEPLDKNCSCRVCQNYRQNYISHLLRAHEITALSLLTFHNLYFFNNYVANLHKKIKEGKL